METFILPVKGYDIRFAAVSLAQAQEAQRQMEREVTEEVLAVLAYEDHQYIR